MELFRFEAGDAPLLINFPHSGTYVPPAIAARLSDAARALPDTDWHVPRLYAFARELGASTLEATHSRYVVDLNRPPDDASLYPGQTTTGLCPRETFAGAALYRDGAAPDESEVAERRDRYWRPYHDRLRAAVDALLAEHGAVLVYDAHSIASRVPRLFDGALPVFNLGTAHGASCAPALRAAAAAVLASSGRSHVVDGRFVGGYITRHYGEPGRGVHAVQMELAQRGYMDEDGGHAFRPEAAAHLAATLRRVLETLLAQIHALAR